MTEAQHFAAWLLNSFSFSWAWAGQDPSQLGLTWKDVTVTTTELKQKAIGQWNDSALPFLAPPISFDSILNGVSRLPRDSH